MFMKSKDQPNLPPEPAIITEPAPAARVAVKPLIGKNVRIKGDIEFDGELVVEGNVHGNVTSVDPSASLVVQPDAAIEGSVKVASIQHHGTITGAVESSGVLTISSTGAVKGPIHYNQLTLEIGAVVHGPLEPVFNDDDRFATKKPTE